MNKSRGRKRYRVLMFGWEFPPHISGGLGTACLGLCTQICKLGTEILFVLPKAQDDHVRFKRLDLISADNVPVRQSITDPEDSLPDELIKYLAIDSPLTPYMNEADYETLMKQRAAQKRLLSQTEDVVKNLEFDGNYGVSLLEEVQRMALVAAELAVSEDFDLIHAHDWMTFPAAVEASRVSGKPLICHVHATEFDRGGQNPSSHIAEIERYGLDNADLIIAVSQRTRSMLIRHYDIDPDRIKVVHNAVEKHENLIGERVVPGHNPKRAEEFRRSKMANEKIVLFLGRVTAQKGPDYFIDAAKLVIKEVKNVRFVMAGDGDLLNQMIERVAEERLQNQFHFTGFLAGEDVARIYSISDVYVMPSVSEPFGITPFEAMVYKVPIIVSRQSGITEVLKHAVKVDFWDTRELADSIIKVLTDEKYARELAGRASRDLDEISWELAAVKVLKNYRKLLNK